MLRDVHAIRATDSAPTAEQRLRRARGFPARSECNMMSRTLRPESRHLAGLAKPLGRLAASTSHLVSGLRGNRSRGAPNPTGEGCRGDVPNVSDGG